MKISLLKGRSHLHVTYKSGGFSNNLIGENFALEVDGSKVVISLDLSPNLRTRNKQGNSYLDAVEFSENHADLAFIELDASLVLESLHRELHRITDPTLVLAIYLGDRGSFEYSVTAEVKQISVQFTVIEDASRSRLV